MDFDRLKRFVHEGLTSHDAKENKGDRGRIGIVGGSEVFTGAPYFAGMAALRSGADLVYVHCHPDAAVPIKCYSPELMVHPIRGVWDPSRETFLSQIERLDCVVLGPGCGTDNFMREVIRLVLELTEKKKIWLICDADVFRVPHGVLGYLHHHCILTPNIAELRKLQSYSDALGKPNTPVFETVAARIAHMTTQLGVAAILLKGEQDIATDGFNVFECGVKGSSRRCGGLGDTLCGVLAALIARLMVRGKGEFQKAVAELAGADIEKKAVAALCYVGAELNREAATMAEEVNEGYISALDVIAQVGPAQSRLTQTRPGSKWHALGT